MKRLAVLGSTGSIGRSCLQVVDANLDAFRIVALAAGRNLDRLEEQVRRYRPSMVVVADRDASLEMASRLGSTTEVMYGEDGLTRAARSDEADLVVCGLVGAAGLVPTWAAVDAGRDVALANKESLVVGGAHLTRRAAETGARILPVDSEHNALHQCLRGEDVAEVRRLWLTASGGPFRERPLETFPEITPEEALRHPTWKMGRKITIDSATLMNKGLEVIEAHWLFGLGGSKIRVVVHPKSVVHSMVEFVDGSFKAQLGVTDMRHPIQYALTWPERRPTDLPEFDPVRSGPIVFEAPDPERFPCLDLAYRALETGGAAAAVLNAANEIAVDAFLNGRARFIEIPEMIRAALDGHADHPAATLSEVMSADRIARQSTAEWLERRTSS